MPFVDRYPDGAYSNNDTQSKGIGWCLALGFTKDQAETTKPKDQPTWGQRFAHLIRTEHQDADSNQVYVTKDSNDQADTGSDNQLP